MPVRFTLIVLTISLLGFTIKSSSAIRCWSCNSDHDPNCADPFYGGRMPLKDCENDRAQPTYFQSSSVCRKVRQIVNGQVVTIRSCGWEQDYNRRDGPCSNVQNSQYVHVEHCSVCSHDACNGANVKIPSMWIPLFGTFTIWLITKYI